MGRRPGRAEAMPRVRAPRAGTARTGAGGRPGEIAETRASPPSAERECTQITIETVASRSRRRKESCGGRSTEKGPAHNGPPGAVRPPRAPADVPAAVRTPRAPHLPCAHRALRAYAPAGAGGVHRWRARRQRVSSQHTSPSRAWSSHSSLAGRRPVAFYFIIYSQ